MKINKLFFGLSLALPLASQTLDAQQGIAVPPSPPPAALSTEATPPREVGFEYVSLLGKKESDPSLKSQIDLLSGDRKSYRDGTVYYDFKRRGVELCFAKGVLESVFLFSEGNGGFAQFPGPLPKGLSFTNDTSQVRERLGKPSKSGEGKWDAWYFPTWVLNVEYRTNGCVNCLAFMAETQQERDATAKRAAEDLALAERGDAEAQYIQGAVCYLSKDYAEAVKWYRKAADQNHAQAQYSLGRCYAEGNGVEKDELEAVKWGWIAARNGYVVRGRGGSLPSLSGGSAGGLETLNLYNLESIQKNQLDEAIRRGKAWLQQHKK